jgi:hypothetical protein
MRPQSSLIDQLFKTVETIGYENTDRLLKSAQFEEIKFLDPIIENVVVNVAKEFNIPAYEIVYGNGRANDRKIAIGFCAHYLKTVFKYERDVIADHIKTHTSLVSRYAGLIQKLNRFHQSDKKYLAIKETLDKTFTK